MPVVHKKRIDSDSSDRGNRHISLPAVVFFSLFLLDHHYFLYSLELEVGVG